MVARSEGGGVEVDGNSVIVSRLGSRQMCPQGRDQGQQVVAGLIASGGSTDDRR
jgi:hypothetical protein